MSTEQNQSALAEVKDQLSLDFADGKYLNIVGNNYGLRRSDVDVSSLNFNDDTWRALVKTLALQYKQVLTKFEDILDIVLGPKVTQVGTFAADIVAGVQSFQVNSDLQFPQVGTLILDEGLATEETVEVCIIDRYNNVVYLSAVTQFDHQAEDADAEEPLTLDLLAGDTEVYIPFSESFPTADFPYTLVLGRGTPNEEVVQLTGNDIANNILTISACLNPHAGAFPSQIQGSLSADYVDAAHFLSLYDVDQFEESGVVILGASDNQYTATGGNVGGTTAVVAASTFTANRHVRSRVVFDAATPTVALRDIEAEIILNTDTTLTFLSPLPAQVAAGDLFNIRAVLEYTGVNKNDLAINLRRDIADITLTTNTTVEMLSYETLVSLGPVKMLGAGWDIYQIDTPGGPPTVEILIPESLRDAGELRRSSYMHTGYITPVPSTTIVGAVLALADTYPVADNTGFPSVGVVTLDAGGGSEDTMAYSIDIASTSMDIDAGATSVTLESGEHFFEVPFEVQLDDGINSEKVTVSAIAGNVATFAATTFPYLSGAEFRAVEYLRAGVEGATPAYAGGESVDLYEPRYAGLTVLDGNLWTVDDTWPGPYVYNPNALGIQQINTGGGLVANTTLDSYMISGPTKVMISQQSTKTALELEDASAFTSAPIPFSLVIGKGSPNPETIECGNIALRQRTFALVNGTQGAGTGSLLLDNLDELTSQGFTGGFSAFPDTEGYRVRIGEGTANDEILFVVGASGSTLTFDNITKNEHANEEVVRLLADVVDTSPNFLTDLHVGVFDYTDREVDVANVGFPATNDGQYFSSTRYNNAEIVQPEYDDVPLLSVAGLPLTGSSLYLNFGDQRVNGEATLTVAANGTFFVPVSSFTVADSTVFPSSADSYPYVVTIEPGTVREEVLEVWDNNTGTGVVTVYRTAPPSPPPVGAPMLFTHPVGSKVVFTPGKEDTLGYQTISGSDIEFGPADTFDQTFYAGTTVTLSPGLDTPQVTGYDFPLILPSDVEEALQSVLDLVRAAGVLVTFLNQP